ncbi:hypothetical protein [Sinorhizobium meliloti]|uniref:hypothetical protein n=1 Tax=Rhizobium meliloti TaxID=382 RepID=UPI000B4A0EA1|nr:hypothetical protein [Sinorhizobium meliloti]ASP68296.1 hypothetical protein CDO29_28000 [Sinorhizobium meliloti]MQX00643.1 hypothetical protein [Sinorhizobium meliloti]RVK54268.1 hypothetical protein CN160_04535 [Sinorhizobium meliloti]
MNPELSEAMGELYTLARLMKDDPAFKEGQRAAAARIVDRFNEVIARITVLSDEEAADLEASTYGKGLHLEEWQISAIKRIYGDDAMTVPVKFIRGKFVR